MGSQSLPVSVLWNVELVEEAVAVEVVVVVASMVFVPPPFFFFDDGFTELTGVGALERGACGGGGCGGGGCGGCVNDIWIFYEWISMCVTWVPSTSCVTLLLCSC